MIDVPKIGAFLSHLRKSRDLTQAELAEQLNISHQAVSKWERGESMPDVGMLPTIATLFGIKVDDLLRGEHAEPKIQVPTEEVTGSTERMETTEELTPDQVDVYKTERGGFQIEDIMRLAPFVGTEMLDEMALIQGDSDRIDWDFVEGLAPFISKKVLHHFVDRLTAAKDAWEVSNLLKLAPFLGKEKLEQLMQKADEGSVDWDVLQGLAPFIGRDVMDRLVNRLVDGSLDASRLAKLAPFLGKESISRLFTDIDPYKMNADVLVKLAPFIDKATLGGILKRLHRKPDKILK